MIKRRNMCFVFLVATVIVLSSCRCSPHGSPHAKGATSAPTSTSSTATHGQGPETHAADPALRSKSLLQLVFSLTQAPPDKAKRPPWIGCQLHLLSSKKIPLQVAVDLGNARRRIFYPRQEGYERHPMIFPYTGDPTKLHIEFHTTLPGPASLHRAPGTWHRPTHAFFLPPSPKDGFAFSCVLRNNKGGGTAIDGYFKDGTPRLNGTRHVNTKGLTPKAMQTYLRRIL